jgi:hypothetical protein
MALCKVGYILDQWEEREGNLQQILVNIFYIKLQQNLWDCLWDTKVFWVRHG